MCILLHNVTARPNPVANPKRKLKPDCLLPQGASRRNKEAFHFGKILKNDETFENDLDRAVLQRSKGTFHSKRYKKNGKNIVYRCIAEG